MTDYGPTCYTDIDPGPARPVTPADATPYRNKTSRADGLLQARHDPDRRDHRRHQQHHRHRRGRRPRRRGSSAPTPRATTAASPVRRPFPGQGPAGGPDRPAPLLALGRARQRLSASPAAQQQVPPDDEQTAWRLPPGRLGTAGNNAGANDELFSFHPGGVNVLFGDGSVRFLKDTVNVDDPPRPRHPQGRRSHLGRPVLIGRSPVPVARRAR